MSQTALDNSQQPKKRVSQYEELMRKFSESHKEQCRAISVDIPKTARWIKQFPTGSQYEGTWDVLGMSGTGIYTFPNGVIYHGEFDDGVFHGEGELVYPSGEILRGKFHHGDLLERTLTFAEGVEYSETDWLYCRVPDRRFTVEFEEGLKPAYESNMTAQLPSREIPPDHYDTEDGFYKDETKMVSKANDLTALLRSPSPHEQKWILDNCRTSISEEIGPRPDLYEEWLEPNLDPEPPSIPAYYKSLADVSLIEDYDYDSDDGSDTMVVEDWRKVLLQESVVFFPKANKLRLKFRQSQSKPDLLEEENTD